MAPTATPFRLEGKALPAITTTRGDLIVSGYAARWEGLDYDAENFLRGAFREAIPAFLGGQAPLLFHHSGDKGLGRVLELEEDDEGLRFKALVAKQERTSPLFHVYDAIRRGIYRGVSVGGLFRRQLTAAGQRIVQARLTEISLTPAAKHPGTWATAIEVKALMGDDLTPVERARRDLELVRRVGRELDVLALRADLMGRFARARS